MVKKTWRIVPRPLMETVLHNHAQHHLVQQPLVLHGPRGAGKTTLILDRTYPFLSLFVRTFSKHLMGNHHVRALAAEFRNSLMLAFFRQLLSLSYPCLAL